MIDILSFGGGVQSWGYAAMVAQGLFPKPDLAIMVDTGRECQSTWDYMERHRSQLPFELRIVHQPLPSIFWETKKKDCLLPAYFKGGKLPPFCSGEWKRDLFRQTLHQRGVEKATCILCISYDEITRMKPSGLQWLVNAHPLVENRIRRGDCISAALDYFGEPPVRSRCWMCPNQHRADWLSLPDNELEQAERIDNQVRRYDLYLSRFVVPLQEGIKYEEAQSTFDDDCDGGYCYV